MKKNSILLFSLTILFIFLLSSCKKDDSEVSGKITYIGAISGIEYNADGAAVYLMINDTEYDKTTTTDSEGNYSFYTVTDGTYHIAAEITVNLIDYSGKSPDFSVSKDDIKTENLILE